MMTQFPACRSARRHFLGFASKVVVGLAGALLLTACSNTSNVTVGSIAADAPKDPAQRTLDARSPVKVAMLLPLSGSPRTAAVAKGLRQAAELALFERNAGNLQLVFKDDKGTPDGARAAAESALKDGAELLIGPLFAKSVTAAAPVARQAGVPMVAFSNDQRVAGDGVYLLSFLPTQDVTRIVAYALTQGHRRFAALIPDDALGRVQESLFRQAVEHDGGRVVALERYPLDVNGMTKPAMRTREVVRGAAEGGSPIDVLFLAGGQDTLPLMGPLLPQADVDPQSVKIIGTGGWDYPNAGHERILAGGWFAAPDPRGWRDFTARFAKTYKSTPPRLASLAYDAVGIAAVLSTGPDGSRYTRANLTRDTGFTGVDGAFKLRADGLSERSLAILEMRKTGPVVLDPAPAAVAPAQALAGVFGFGAN